MTDLTRMRIPLGKLPLESIGEIRLEHLEAICHIDNRSPKVRELDLDHLAQLKAQWERDSKGLDLPADKLAEVEKLTVIISEHLSENKLPRVARVALELSPQIGIATAGTTAIGAAMAAGASLPVLAGMGVVAVIAAVTVPTRTV